MGMTAKASFFVRGTVQTTKSNLNANKKCTIEIEFNNNLNLTQKGKT